MLGTQCEGYELCRDCMRRGIRASIGTQGMYKELNPSIRLSKDALRFRVDKVRVRVKTRGSLRL